MPFFIIISSDQAIAIFWRCQLERSVIAIYIISCLHIFVVLISSLSVIATFSIDVAATNDRYLRRRRRSDMSITLNRRQRCSGLDGCRSYLVCLFTDSYHRRRLSSDQLPFIATQHLQ